MTEVEHLRATIQNLGVERANLICQLCSTQAQLDAAQAEIVVLKTPKESDEPPVEPLADT